MFLQLPESVQSRAYKATRPGGQSPDRGASRTSLLPVRVNVKLFAGLRERAGTDELALELPEGAHVAEALAQMSWLTGDVPVVMAVNLDYADQSTVLRPGDDLALIPPVSGGSDPGVHARVVDHPLSADELQRQVRDPRAGAIVTFLGVTREVPALDYEAYAEMAERQLREIALAALERHGLCRAAVEHRVGRVELSEPSVIVAVSAPHRGEAFTGAREIIDRVKAVAPIWKREQGEWVAGSSPVKAVEPPSR